MEKNIFYEEAKLSAINLFDLEFPTLPQQGLEQLLNFFYAMSNYEEESVKIKPELYITNNINMLTKTIPNCYKLSIFHDTDSRNFKQRTKAIMCFCKNDWQLYINFGDGFVEYGLIKVLSSIKDKSLHQLVFEDYLDTIQSKISLININVVSGGMIVIQGVKNNKVSISFDLNSVAEYSWDDKIATFVNACTSKLNTKSKRKLEDIRNIYKNLFQKLFKGLHGTICLVIDKDYVDTKGFLEDGIWLKEPIEFSKLFLQSKFYNEFKLTSYADLITTMLNFDGITIIDNAGRVRAYNVFIESNQKASEKIVGGARKRAAYTLLKHKDNKFVGVYFQSQDGANFFEESAYYKKRKQDKSKKEE
ncbi:MAG: hypothetical protein IJA61_03220 [Clostridia bacterium]|nr:hypothetical protein [Clostridia bacterium]